MKVPKPVFDEYKSILMEERQLLKNGKSISIPQLQWQLLSIEGKMKSIENKVLTITNEGLIKRLKEEWSTFETLKDELLKKIKNHKKSRRHLWNHFIAIGTYVYESSHNVGKQQFWDKAVINYGLVRWIFILQKKQWLRTNKNTGLHCPFSLIADTNTHAIRKGVLYANRFKLTKTELNLLINSLLEQSNYINAIHKVSEIHGLNRNIIL